MEIVWSVNRSWIYDSYHSSSAIRNLLFELAVYVPSVISFNALAANGTHVTCMCPLIAC